MMKRLCIPVIASLALTSCSSNDHPGTVCTDYSLEVVEESSPPLIDRNHPGSAENRQGYEGGTVFMKDGIYHMFVTEEINGWVGTRTGYWKSSDGVKWERISTIMESVDKPDDSRNAVWSPMPFYNENEGRWNMFYVGYEARGAWNGRIFRAVSETRGKDGLAGPYIDVPGTVLSYTDSIKDPWEGRQGAAAFYIFKAGPKWYGFYASGDSHTRWDEGLAVADSMEGRWQRDDNPNPTLTYAENPIVVQLEDGAFFCVFDDLAHGEFTDNAITRESSSTIGYAYSIDGVHWSQSFLSIPKPSWASNIRTPQSFIPAGGGQYWIYFTANTPEGFDCVARIKVRLLKRQISKGNTP